MAVTLEAGYFPRLFNSTPLDPVEIFKFEALRLKTFSSWTSYDRASPIYLAKSGFIYTDSDDIVKCFSCNVTQGNWNRNMNPLDVHRELSPQCSFIRETESINFPIVVPGVEEYQRIQETLHQRYCGSETPVGSFAETSAPRESSDTPSFIFRQNLPAASQTHFPVVATDAGAAETSRQAIGVRGALGRGQESEAAPTREEFAPMKQESNRFTSFDGNWPRHGTPDPRDLARAGFYYTGTVDRVQCVFCRGILRNWDEDDVPMDEHRRHFPMCPFVMGMDVGNIPDPTAIIGANRIGDVASLSVTQPNAVVSDASLGIVTERPKHSQYAVEASRVSSFRNWPSGKEQTPQMLAKAGFFYAGFGDSVKCFFCDGGLRTWERGDDPWVEHARWFPRCPYVRQVKGEDFIKQSMEGNVPSTMRATANSSSNNVSRPASQGISSTAPAARNVDPRELSSRMDSPIVQTVLAMDIPRDRVAKVILKRLQETGDDFPSVETLMEAIFQAESAADSTSSSRSSSTSSASTSAPPPAAPPPAAIPPPSPQGDRFNTERKAPVDGGQPPAVNNDAEMRNADDSDDSLADSDSQSLLQENRELKEQRQCKVCMDAEVNVVFLPCGHLVCCALCAPALAKCPICRSSIRGTVRTFLS